LANPARDSTALTIVESDLATLSDDLIQAPRYLVRHADPSFLRKELWTGTRHTALYAQLKALAELWDPRYIVQVNKVDTATGVGAGLSSFLEKAYPTKVLPFLFNYATKSKLGWDFIAVVETGRFKDHHPQGVENGGTSNSPKLNRGTIQSNFWRQLSACQMEISLGPNRSMK